MKAAQVLGKWTAKHFVVVLWEQGYWRDRPPILLPPGRENRRYCRAGRHGASGTGLGWLGRIALVVESSGLGLQGIGIFPCGSNWSFMWSRASHSVIQHFWFPSHLLPLFLRSKLCGTAVVSQPIHSLPRGTVVVKNGVVILKKTSCYRESGDLTVQKWKKLRSCWKSWFYFWPSCLK